MGRSDHGVIRLSSDTDVGVLLVHLSGRSFGGICTNSILDIRVIKCAIPGEDALVCLLSVVLDDTACPLQGPMSRLTLT